MEATTTAGEQVALAAETLTGDIRDQLLPLICGMETPWSKLSERDQKWRIESITKAAERAVRGAVRIVANQGFPHIAMRTGKWNVNDGLKLEVTGAASVENITRLAEHGPGECILVLVEVGEYFGERASVRAEPDQRAMDLDEDPVEEARREAEVDAAEDEAEGEASASEGPTPAAEAAAPEAPRRGRRRAIRETEAA